MMHFRRPMFLVPWATITALALLTSPPMRLQAAEPTGEALMDAYVEATGGRAAFDKLQTRKVEATMDVGAQNGQVGVTIWAAKPDKVYSEVDVPGVGKIISGSDGKVAWELSPVGGARVKQGAERVMTLREANQDRFAYWRDLFKKAEYAGKEQVGDKECHKVLLTPKTIDPAVEETPVTVFIDPETNLIVQLQQTIATPAGSVPMTVQLGDYREADGVLIAREMQFDVSGQSFGMQIDRVANNVELPEDRFALPEAVRKVMKQGQTP